MKIPSSPEAVRNKRFIVQKNIGKPVIGTVVQCVAYSAKGDVKSFVGEWRGEYGPSGKTIEWDAVEPMAERVPLFR